MKLINFMIYQQKRSRIYSKNRIIDSLLMLWERVMGMLSRRPDGLKSNKVKTIQHKTDEQFIRQRNESLTKEGEKVESEREDLCSTLDGPRLNDDDDDDDSCEKVNFNTQLLFREL